MELGYNCFSRPLMTAERNCQNAGNFKTPRASLRRARLDLDQSSRHSRDQSFSLKVIAMLKIAIGSGLTILAVAAPVQAFEVTGVAAPAGVTDAGAVRLSEPAPGDSQPVKEIGKPVGAPQPDNLEYEFKLTNAATAERPAVQTKQPGQTNRSKRRSRPQGYGKQD